MSYLNLGPGEETIPPGGNGSRRKAVVATGISATALATALATFGPQVMTFVSDVSSMKATVKAMEKDIEELKEENRMLRNWAQLTDRRWKYQHGDFAVPEEPQAAAPDAR